jgi:hypothetical protein
MDSGHEFATERTRSIRVFRVIHGQFIYLRGFAPLREASPTSSSHFSRRAAKQRAVSRFLRSPPQPFIFVFSAFLAVASDQEVI